LGNFHPRNTFESEGFLPADPVNASAFVKKGRKEVPFFMKGKKYLLDKYLGGFLKWWYPKSIGFPTKNDHFGVFWGYHHFRKHPFGSVFSNLVDVTDTYGPSLYEGRSRWSHFTSRLHLPRDGFFWILGTGRKCSGCTHAGNPNGGWHRPCLRMMQTKHMQHPVAMPLGFRG